MTVIHEVEQVLWLETPHGDGIALFIIDYGPQENIIFVVALRESKKIKHYNSNQVTISTNFTFDILPDKK